MLTTNPSVSCDVENNTVTLSNLTAEQVYQIRYTWETRRFFHSEVNQNIGTNTFTYSFSSKYGFIQGYKLAAEYVNLLTDTVVVSITEE